MRSEIATDRASVTMMAVVLAPRGLSHVVKRRLEGVEGGLWRVRVVHDPVTAMAELAVLERGDHEVTSQQIDTGKSERSTPRVVFIFAQPAAGPLRREMFDAIARYLPGVHAITFDEHSLRLIEQNAALFACRSSRHRSPLSAFRPPVSVVGPPPIPQVDTSTADGKIEHPKRRERGAENEQQIADSDSISREEIDMLLQESAPAGAFAGHWNNGGRR